MSVAYGDDQFLPEPPPYDDLAGAAAGSGIDLDTRAGVDDVVGATITRWRDLPLDQHPEAWEELRGFVEWLVTRYEVTDNVVPHCWFRHGGLVEELSALRAAWDASFIVETDGGLGPIGWHERFAVARGRLSQAYGGECNRRGHTEQPDVVLHLDEDAWAAWKEEQ